MTIDLPNAIYIAGLGQLSVLIASSLVPVRLDWKAQLAALPTLVRQLYWVYGGYVVLSIELASGTRLARSFCAFAAIFWGVRLSLQPFLAARPFLTTWWLRAGYHLLSVWFAAFVLVFAWAAIR
jgi:hypothetical protein